MEAALVSAVQAAADADVDLEMIVVDNASADGSAGYVATTFPSASIISNAGNVGFGRATNQGFERASGDWWLLLNPDAELERASLRALLEFAIANPGVGAAAPSITGAGTERAESAGMQPGVRAALGHFLFFNRLLPGDRGGAWRGFQLHRRRVSGPRPVEWASAAALLLRPAAVRAVGGFDPSFFLYAEDVDLGQRLISAGWAIWLVPEAHARHSVAASQGGVTPRWIEGLHDYVGRRRSAAVLVAIDLIAGAGLGLRAAAVTADPRMDRGSLHGVRMRVSARRVLVLAAKQVRLASGRRLGEGQQDPRDPMT